MTTVVGRRAQVWLLGNALLMGGLAVAVSLAIDVALTDPEGSFLGPSWLRLPLLLVGAVVLDVLPRTLWLSRMDPRRMPALVMARLQEHWTRDRLVLVFSGVVSFYVVYVSYRNLKSFLPFVMGEAKYDRELHLLDQVLFLGQEPALVMQDLLGTTVSAYVLSFIYLWFLPMVPLGVTAWLVWARPAHGYWFVVSQCVAWTLGTLSYYMLPTLGPGFRYPWLYENLADTPTTALMNSLHDARMDVVHVGVEGAVQSVAGFASLHTAITLLLALMVQATFRSTVLKALVWYNFALTIVATLYFGWHYVADDVAGILIAVVAFYVGGVVSGHSFERHPGRRGLQAEEEVEPGEGVQRHGQQQG